MSGIFVSQGMDLGIPEGGLELSFGPDGKLTGNLTLHLGFDVCPTWIDLSLRHLSEAKCASEACRAAWTGSDGEAKRSALEREFEASMQAMMAAAIAMDAFYERLLPHAKIDANTIEAWRRNKTARHAQIAEVIRRPFKLKASPTKSLKAKLKQVYECRDRAVHPSSKTQPTTYRSDLDVGVEWRFGYFTAINAERIVNAVGNILWQLCHNGVPANDKVKAYTSNLRPRLEAFAPKSTPAPAQS